MHCSELASQTSSKSEAVYLLHSWFCMSCSMLVLDKPCNSSYMVNTGVYLSPVQPLRVLWRRFGGGFIDCSCRGLKSRTQLGAQMTLHLVDAIMMYCCCNFLEFTRCV